MLSQIIVIAYNRPKSLKRLLDSIATANYSNKNIELVISIDGIKNHEVVKISEEFDWKYGSKYIIVQKQNLGLKNHILLACDNAALKGDFIVLEDDLSVSPYYYQYAVSALNYFRYDIAIAGVSLYSYAIAESCLLSFSPLEDDYDNYFIKFPSSWGQCFTAEQWTKFRNFTSKEHQVVLPTYISEWKGESWKKDFATYMISQNNFFVFPKISLTTNFGEKGTNFPFTMDIFNVPLQLVEKEYNFQNFLKSINKFDEYFELLSESLKKMVHSFCEINFAVDIYGTKELRYITESYVLTSRKAKNIIKRPGKELPRLYINNFKNIQDGKIVLCKKSEVTEPIIKPDFGHHMFLHNYKNNPPPSFLRLKLFVFRINFMFFNYLHWVKRNFIR